MPDQAAMIAAIETHCRALSAGDKDAWLQIWADDAILEDPVGVDTFRGLDDLRTRFWPIIETISPMRIWREQEIIVCGNEAIAILAAEVNREGPTRRVGPLVDHFTFNEDGKVASMRAFWKYEGVPGY
jgi:steroid delta-isomerase